MKTRLNWQITLGLSLILLSVLLYVLHYAIFRDTHHIFIYMVGDIAFVPIEVLLVTLIIHELLQVRERQIRLEKLNMVIGAFFSEVGTDLLAYFSDLDPKLNQIRERLIVDSEWSDEEFTNVSQGLRSYDYSVEIQSADCEQLGSFLANKRDFLLRLLENPNLLEHESFTELLRAVFHLTEEISRRENLAQMCDTDRAHLAVDIARAYVLLVHQWLDYMRHLKDNYPYLFSLAMRTNPFDQTASPIVR
jgi:hypothetical protein